MSLNLSGISSMVYQLMMIAIGIIVLIGVFVFAYFVYNRWLKYREFTFIIWRKDGFGQLQQSTDSGGIFVDGKTHNKRLFMRKSNVGLSTDKIPYISANGKKIVYLYQTGLKNFRIIKPQFKDDGVELDVGEEDVNWAVNAYERQKKTICPNPPRPNSAISRISYCQLCSHHHPHSGP